MCICSGIAVAVFAGDAGSVRGCTCRDIAVAGDAGSGSTCICSDIPIAVCAGNAERVRSASAKIQNTSASQVS